MSLQLEHIEVALWIVFGMLFLVIILLGFLLEGARKDRKERHEREREASGAKQAED